MEFHEKLPNLAAKEGLKGRKVSRALESFSWNITILKVSNTLTHTLKQPNKPRGGPLVHVLASNFIVLPSFSTSVYTSPCYSLFSLPSLHLSSIPGTGRPAEACQSRSPGEYETGPWCCPNWKPHKGESRIEESSLPDTTRSRWQTHREC